MHSFDPNIAARVGVNAAVIYQNIVWWCSKNAANGHNEHDGRFWTYNSVKAWAKLFPYLTASQIRLSLEKLEKNGLILSGSFNEVGYDRTKWYCPSEQIHLSENANGIARNAEPIPVSKPDNKPDNISAKADERFEEFWAVAPRKIAKGAARKAWAAAVKKADPGTIIEAFKKFAASQAKQEPKFIPHPATWLNAERWEDEAPAAAKKYKYMQDTFGNLLRRRVGSQEQWTHFKDAGTWTEADCV